jgi:hypothetical protein
MTVEYPGHLLKTRRQALLQSVVLMLILIPLLAWRFTTEPRVVALALGALTFAPFAIAHRGWKFLESQEKLHAEPTAEMTFVFELVAVVPLALGVLLMVLLFRM